MDATRTLPSRRLKLLIDVPLARVWHARLADRLRAAGHDVTLASRRKPPLPGPAILLALERRIYGASAALFAPGPQPPVSPARDDAFDLVVRLEGIAATDPAASYGSLHALFDGVVGEAAMFGALLAGRAPRLTILRARGNKAAPAQEGIGPEVASAGQPAVEDPTVLARALDHVLARLVVLLAQAVERVATDADMTPAETHTVAARGAGPGHAAAFLARTLVRKVARRLARVGTDHWHVGWRRLDDPGVADALAWPKAAYATLPDDGTAYYADPFPFEHEGRTYLFCEKFPYATEKGLIVVFEVGQDGRVSAARPVLEQAGHLSYPQVFARDGAIFMLPETGSAGRIELFRAESFPDRWVSHAVLIEGIVAADATLVEHGGLFWLFASLAGDGGSSWDQLALYHAPALEGPWEAHAGNPVLVDAGAARPAGAMWTTGGVLWRVAQDCRAGYGAGLTICRVDRLDAGGYAQTVVARLGPPDGLGAEGVHTLNRTGRLETIDWRAPRRR